MHKKTFLQIAHPLDLNIRFVFEMVNYSGMKPYLIIKNLVPDRDPIRNRKF